MCRLKWGLKWVAFGLVKVGASGWVPLWGHSLAMSSRRHVDIGVTHDSGKPTPASHAWCEKCNILLPRVDKRNPNKVIPIMMSIPTVGIVCPNCRDIYGVTSYIETK